LINCQLAPRHQRLKRTGLCDDAGFVSDLEETKWLEIHIKSLAKPRCRAPPGAPFMAPGCRSFNAWGHCQSDQAGRFLGQARHL